jgi:hypothetical protein
MRLLPIRAGCAFAACLALIGCGRQTVSGKYLAKFTNGFYWLQIVETPDKHVSGQFETLVLGSDGRIEMSDLPVFGAADDRDLTLSLGQSSFLTRPVSVSGTLKAGKLTLTGPFSGNQLSSASTGQVREHLHLSALLIYRRDAR